MRFTVFIISMLAFTYVFAVQEEEPAKLDIEFLSALVAPSKVNGNSWDSKATINGAAAAVVSEMLLPGSGTTASSVVSAVANSAPKGAAAPDVIGYVVQKGPTTRSLANVAGIPIALALRSQKTQDSYTPRFYAGYQGWPVYPETRFQIQLWDADLINDDQIAVVELSYKQLMSAAEEGKPTWVKVADQSMNQLLYVLVSVSKSLEATMPKMSGYRWKSSRH